jgi:hypothetical protein
MRRACYAQKLSLFTAARKACGVGSRPKRSRTALEKYQCRRRQDDRSFIFDHIRMIERRNDAADPFIKVGELGWGALEDWI